MRSRLRHEGFHFFKDPKGITFISRIKTQKFESIGHLSEQIQKIILFLREHIGCKRKRLIEHFAPPTVAPSATASPTETAAPSADTVAIASGLATDASAPAIPAPVMPSAE